MVAHPSLRRLTAASDVGIEVTRYRDCLDYQGAEEPHIKALKVILQKHWVLIPAYIQPPCCQALQPLIQTKTVDPTSTGGSCQSSSPQWHLTPGSSSLALVVLLGACGLAYLWFSAKTKYCHACISLLGSGNLYSCGDQRVSPLCHILVVTLGCTFKFFDRTFNWSNWTKTYCLDLTLKSGSGSHCHTQGSSVGVMLPG